MNHAAPGLALAITTRLQQWRNGETLTFPQSVPVEVRDVIFTQDELGWEHFCFGLVSHNITTYQHNFLAASGRKSREYPG